MSDQWTVDTLKTFLEQRLNDLEKQIDQRFEATQIAVTKAEVASEKRFDSVNEFRASLADQSANLMPRAEAEIRLSGLEKKVDTIDRALGDKIAVLDKSLGDKLDTLRLAMERDQGRSAGLGAGWGYLVAAVGVIGAVIGIFFALRP